MGDILQEVLSMDMKLFGKEALASVVVFLVALPLCMGIAIASGAPPAAGLVSGIIGGLVVGKLAGSPLQVSGPAAGLAVLVYELIQQFGFAALGPAVLLAGLLQVAAGKLHVGQWFRAVSPAVIHGMLAGIGVLIFASQVHVMVDDSPGANGLTNLLTIPLAIKKGVLPMEDTPHHLAAMVGLATLITMIAWNSVREKLRPALAVMPAPLLGVSLAVVIAAVAGLDIRYVEVPREISAFVLLPTAESLSNLLNPGFLVSAVALALIASAEALLCAAAVDKIHSGVRTDFDKELVAQGVGNTLAGLVGALPITGVIVRSSANVGAGATTRWSAVMHGGWLLLTISALPFVLEAIPVASLAAILVYIGWKLFVKPVTWRELKARGTGELVIYGITVVAIVSTNLLTGIGVGIALAVIKLVWTMSHLKVDVEEVEQGVWHVHLRGAATFVGLPSLARTLEGLPETDEVHVHLEDLSYIDHACLELIGDWERQREPRGGTLVLEWEKLEARNLTPKLAS
jgi:MFS superfamily sulfate permease-like transporter